MRNFRINHAMLDIIYFQYRDLLLFAASNIASFLNYDKLAIYLFYCENPIYSYFRQFCISVTFLDDSVTREFDNSTDRTTKYMYSI